jgi:hypothetical protein
MFGYLISMREIKEWMENIEGDTENVHLNDHENEDDIRVNREQRSANEGPLVTSGSRPFLTRPENRFVNLLLVTADPFIFFDPK